MLMAKTRTLNDTEKSELVYALALAAKNNAKHAKESKRGAEDTHHAQEQIDLEAMVEKYALYEKIDREFAELIRSGRLVIIVDDEGEDEE